MLVADCHGEGGARVWTMTILLSPVGFLLPSPSLDPWNRSSLAGNLPKSQPHPSRPLPLSQLTFPSRAVWESKVRARVLLSFASSTSPLPFSPLIPPFLLIQTFLFFKRLPIYAQPCSCSSASSERCNSFENASRIQLLQASEVQGRLPPPSARPSPRSLSGRPCTLRT